MEKKIIELLDEIKLRQKKDREDIMKAIRKNRTTIIKKAFDKSMISPMIESNAGMRDVVEKRLNEIQNSLTRTIDVLATRINDKIKDGLISIINIFSK